MPIQELEARPEPTSSERRRQPRVAFVHNLATHYRTKVFEALSNMCNVEFYFYSDGGEPYWQRSHGVAPRVGFVHRGLMGFWLGQTRITPTLIPALLFRSYDVFVKCINGRFALPATFCVARLRRAPFVLWTGIWHRLDTPFHRLVFPLTRYIYRHADAVVAYGEHVKRYLISEGVQPDRIFIAAQSVNNDRYRTTVSSQQQQALRSRCEIAENQKVVLYLGRLEPGKGLDYLLEAFARTKSANTVLVLCGSGSEEANLRHLAAKLKIEERVRFTGYVPTSQAVLFYSLAWVSVLPSVTTPTFKEPWGLTVNESFNQGVPVIATDAVGAAAGGLVRNGWNGFVIPERDAVRLHSALETMLDNAELRNRLARNAASDIASWTPLRTAGGFRDAIEFATSRRRENPSPGNQIVNSGAELR